MVGAGRARAQRAGRRARPHRAQPGPAHGVGRAARVHQATCSGSSTSYSLVLAAALLPAGLLGDRFGRKKMLITGAVVVFGLASLACAYSPSAGELIAARAVLGLGAAVILPLSLAVLPVLFTPAERPRAIAVVMRRDVPRLPGRPDAGRLAAGQLLVGLGVPDQRAGRGARAGRGRGLLMPESHGGAGQRIDVAGIVALEPGPDRADLRLHQGGRTAGPTRPRWPPWSAGVAGCWPPSWPGSAAGGTARGRAAAGRAELFRSAGFTWGTILATLVSFALFGILFAMPQYFQDVRGLDSLGAGLRLLPMIGGMASAWSLGQRLQTPRKRQDGQPRRPGQPQDPGGRRVRGDGRGAGRSGPPPASAAAPRSPRPGSPSPGSASAWPCRPRMNAALGALSPSAQRLGLGADHRDAPGRGHDRGRRAGHVLAIGLPQPACTWPGCPPRRRSACANRRLRRRRGGARSLGSAAAAATRWRSRSCTAWTSCSGCARASRWPRPCWRWPSCPRRTPRPQAAPATPG